MTATLVSPPSARTAVTSRSTLGSEPVGTGQAAPRARTHPRPTRPGPISTGRRAAAGTVVEHPAVVGAQPHAAWDRMRFQPDLDPEEARKDRRNRRQKVQHPPSPEPVEMPDPVRSAATIVTAACEVLTGHRPADQLAKWTTPELFEAISRRAGLARRLLGPSPQPARLRMRSVRTQPTTYGACEATVLLDDGSRVRAAAARLEAYRGRWILSRLEIA